MCVTPLGFAHSMYKHAHSQQYILLCRKLICTADVNAGFVKNSIGVVGVHLSFNQTEAISKQVFAIASQSPMQKTAHATHAHTLLQMQSLDQKGNH